MVLSQNEIDGAYQVIIKEIIDLFLIPKFKELGMEATGEWIENVHSKGSELWGRDYTKYLVEGRPPSAKMPPIEALEKWVRAKFGYSDQRQVRSTAFAVAKKIQQEGTNYYPDGTDLMEVLNSMEVTEFINRRLSEELISLQGEKFSEYIINTFNRK